MRGRAAACAMPAFAHTASRLSCCPQVELEQRAQRYGCNSVRPPREVTFLELVQEALQVWLPGCLAGSFPAGGCCLSGAKGAHLVWLRGAARWLLTACCR